MSNNRMGFITFLRAMAAVIVLLCHLFIMFWSGGVSSIWPFLATEVAPYSSIVHNVAVVLDNLKINTGSVGVGLFFLITGFLVVASAEKYREPGRFILAKVLRLYPTYIVGFSITFLSIWLYTHYNGIPFPYNAKDWFLQVTLIQGFIWKPSIDAITWTLVADVQFFVLIAIMIVLKQIHLKGFVRAGLILSALSFLSSIMVPKFAELGKANLYYAGNIIILACFCMTFMLIGSTLYEFYIGRNEVGLSIVSIVILYVCFIFCCVFDSPGNLSTVCSYSFSLLIFILCMFFGKQGYCSRLYGNVAVTFIARISYPLYIVHGLNGYILETAMFRAGISKMIIFPATVLIVFAAATLLHYLIEKPMGKLDRIILK